MMPEFRITSEAQRQMFEKAAADPEYAKTRGITQDMARQFMEAHKAAGSPTLPDRVPAQKPKSKLIWR